MSSPHILTLDIGTTSTRASLYDSRAEPVPGATVRVANTLITAESGQATFDAGHLTDNVVNAVDQLLAIAPSDVAIRAVTMDSFVGNVLGLDNEGRPMTPVYTYADTRNAQAVTALRAELGEDAVAAAHQRTGCMLHTSYLPARFRWLARHAPDLFHQVACWVSVTDYLGRLWTGRLACGYSVAAWSGLLNRHSLTWDATWLDRLALDADRLPPLLDTTTALGPLATEWAERWPALADAQVYPGVGDGAAANIGSGCDRPGRIALTVGTTGALRMVVDPSLAAVPSGLWLYRVDAPRGLLGGATTEGGNLFAWLQTILRLPPSAELEEALLARPPAGHGLQVLPFIAGERAPGWNEDARAHFSGMGLNTDAVDLVQAALEGVAYRFTLIAEGILGHLPDASDVEIIASGGALMQSPAWLQIIADALGRRVTTLEAQELTSRGMALLGLEALGVIERAGDLPAARAGWVDPRPHAHARHREAIDAQVALYQAVL